MTVQEGEFPTRRRGRRPTLDRAMTPAERQRLYRCRKKGGDFCNGFRSVSALQKALQKRGKPKTQAQRDRAYLRRKTARGRREEARRLRDEADRRAAEQGNGIHYGVHCMDVDHVMPEMLPRIVDAVITDPPYARETLPWFSSLARCAERVLRPGGWCAVMGGQIFLPEVLRLLGEHLTYRWQYVLPLLGGQHAHIRSVGVFEDYKTVLLFQKPPATRIRECWGGLIPSKTAAALEQSKQLHKWQQPQTPFDEIVRRLTVAGDLVVDPFAGSGTTGRAAVSQGRHFWGCDVDPECATVPAA